MCVLCLTSSVLVAQVREPPHVAEPHGKADAGHDEVHLPRPCLPLGVPRHCPRDHGSFLVRTGASTATASRPLRRCCQRDEAAIGSSCMGVTHTAAIGQKRALLGLLQEDQRAGGGWKGLLLHHSEQEPGRKQSERGQAMAQLDSL